MASPGSGKEVGQEGPSGTRVEGLVDRMTEREELRRAPPLGA